MSRKSMDKLMECLLRVFHKLEDIILMSHNDFGLALITNLYMFQFTVYYDEISNYLKIFLG